MATASAAATGDDKDFVLPKVSESPVITPHPSPRGTPPPPVDPPSWTTAEWDEHRREWNEDWNRRQRSQEAVWAAATDDQRASMNRPQDPFQQHDPWARQPSADRPTYIPDVRQAVPHMPAGPPAGQANGGHQQTPWTGQTQYSRGNYEIRLPHGLHIPSYNGDMKTLSDFEYQCDLLIESCTEEQRCLLAHRIMIAFEGTLNINIADKRVSASEFKTSDGLPRLIGFVKKILGVDPTLEAEKVFHNFIFQFGKRSFSSLRDYVDAEETAYSDMQRIMGAQGLDFKIPSVVRQHFAGVCCLGRKRTSN